MHKTCTIGGINHDVYYDALLGDGVDTEMDDNAAAREIVLQIGEVEAMVASIKDTTDRIAHDISLVRPALAQVSRGLAIDLAAMYAPDHPRTAEFAGEVSVMMDELASGYQSAS